jgi:hypothetical protein
MHVVRLSTKEYLVGGVVVASAAGTMIEQVCGSGQCIGLERGRCAGMQQHRVHAVIQCAKNALGVAILL